MYQKDITVICIYRTNKMEKTMQGMQLDLFQEPKSDHDVLKEEVRLTRMSQENMRRAMFAQINECCKLLIFQQEQIDELKKERTK